MLTSLLCWTSLRPGHIDRKAAAKKILERMLRLLQVQHLWLQKSAEDPQDKSNCEVVMGCLDVKDA